MGRGERPRQGRDTHTMNSDRLHHFQTSTVRIMSAKAFPHRGSFSSMRVSLQPPTRGQPPREGTAWSFHCWGHGLQHDPGALLLTLPAPQPSPSPETGYKKGPTWVSPRQDLP